METHLNNQTLPHTSRPEFQPNIMGCPNAPCVRYPFYGFTDTLLSNRSRDEKAGCTCPRTFRLCACETRAVLKLKFRRPNIFNSYLAPSPNVRNSWCLGKVWSYIWRTSRVIVGNSVCPRLPSL